MSAVRTQACQCYTAALGNTLPGVFPAPPLPERTWRDFPPGYYIAASCIVLPTETFILHRIRHEQAHKGPSGHPCPAGEAASSGWPGRLFDTPIASATAANFSYSLGAKDFIQKAGGYSQVPLCASVLSNKSLGIKIEAANVLTRHSSQLIGLIRYPYMDNVQQQTFRHWAGGIYSAGNSIRKIWWHVSCIRVKFRRPGLAFSPAREVSSRRCGRPGNNSQASYPHRPERLRFQTLSFPRWNHSETKCGIPPSSPRAFARVFPGRSSFSASLGNSISSMRPQLSPQSLDLLSG